jgi:phytoene dehydrogenase-like protein
MKKFEEQGGEIRFRTAVSEILCDSEGRAIGVTAGGGEILADQVFSSIGLPETAKITPRFGEKITSRLGNMTFLESIFVFDKKISLQSNSSTITFYNNSPQYMYRPAKDFFDPCSAVVCFPDHYESQNHEGEGIIRVTYMANYSQWRELKRDVYDAKKQEVADSALALVKKLTPGFDGQLLFKDIFSPTTIEHYTWHLNGTVYGSVDKSRNGLTPIKNLYIIGTDQGFLGIVGAILSGISMANLHGLAGIEV